ncbi:MAG: hypothetical protein IT576_16555 [Verrucomicrobiales bacterium]|nr:hypothetical protein [Verrucomicrobiales bacterium]
MRDLDPEIYLEEVIRRQSPTSTPEQIAELTPAKLPESLARDRAEAAAQTRCCCWDVFDTACLPYRFVASDLAIDRLVTGAEGAVASKPSRDLFRAVVQLKQGFDLQPLTPLEARSLARSPAPTSNHRPGVDDIKASVGQSPNPKPPPTGAARWRPRKPV